MGTKTIKPYYLIPHGTTQEEQWSWGDIEEMYRTGRLSPESRIFMPDQNEWVRVADTEIAGVLEDISEEPEESAADEERRAELESEYEAAASHVRESPRDVDALLDAARLAMDIDDGDRARGYLQRALKIRPFDGRIVQAVRRQFSRAECHSFQFLERRPPAWEDMGEMVAFPIARGFVYPAVLAAALALALIIPVAGFIVAPVCFLVWLQSIRHVADGHVIPPVFERVRNDPLGEVAAPLAAGVVVTALMGGVIYGVARLGMYLENADGQAISYVLNSPIFVVVLSLSAAAYLPAVLVRIAYSPGRVSGWINPAAVVRSVIRMEGEYPATVGLLILMVFAWGLLRLVTSSIPVVGEILAGLLGSYLMLVSAFVLGRVLDRNRHRLG